MNQQRFNTGQTLLAIAIIACAAIAYVLLLECTGIKL